MSLIYLDRDYQFRFLKKQNPVVCCLQKYNYNKITSKDEKEEKKLYHANAK